VVNLRFCSFILSGEFAAFRKPDVNNIYLTYNLVPYSSLLGIFGAMTNKAGYADQKGMYPEYYEYYYKSLYVGIKPVFTKRLGGFQKHFVKFCNLHGYGSNESGGNLIITEQILIAPRWRIFLFDENDKHQELINKLKDNQTIFTPYLGKNEFRAEIRDFKQIEGITEITDELKTKKAMKFDSVVLLKTSEQHPIKKNLSTGMNFDDLDLSSSYISDDGYSVFENYPYALGGDLHYKLCLSAFTNWEIDTDMLRNGSRIFKIRDTDEAGQINERVIQMFNGGLE